MIDYDALVRTYNSEETVSELLSGLSALNTRPAKIIVIDSGSTDDTVRICRSYGCIVFDYAGPNFNYSRALNQGLNYVDSDYCLIVSSHMVVVNSNLIEIMVNAIQGPSLAAVSVDYCANDYDLQLIDATNFNGYNGIWNTCALYKSNILKAYGFDPRLPTAEDQHFSSRVISDGYKTVRLTGGLVCYKNPYVSNRKIRNERVSIAYYSYRPLMSLKSILAVFRCGFKHLFRLELGSSLHYIKLGFRLLLANVVEPKFNSRYFK